MYVYSSMYVWMCVCVNMFMCVDVYMCTCVHVCMCVFGCYLYHTWAHMYLPGNSEDECGCHLAAAFVMLLLWQLRRRRHPWTKTLHMKPSLHVFWSRTTNLKQPVCERSNLLGGPSAVGPHPKPLCGQLLPMESDAALAGTFCGASCKAANTSVDWVVVLPLRRDPLSS